MNRTPHRPRWWARVAAAASVGALLLTGLPAGTQAMAASDLGPTVVKTDTGPTGYEVTFRYEAPADVTSVQINGEWFFSRAYSLLALNGGDARSGDEWQPKDIVAGPWGSREMTKGTDGVWTWTTALPSGTFSYGFYHDGSTAVRYADPAVPGFNDTAEWNKQNMSQVYVPQSAKFPTYANDYQAPPAKAGKLLQLAYATPFAINPVGRPQGPDGEHTISVYLPAGYDPNRAEPYPTMYISHGGQGVDTDWFTQGVGQNIVSNAIADGDAKQMVVVATNFQGFHASFNNSSTDAIKAYADDLEQYGIPFVESNFNVSKKSMDRALASLSAGGLRLLEFLYNRPGVFEYYGLWSAGGNSPMPTLEQTANISKVKGIIQIGVGYQDWQNSINALSYERAGEIRRSTAVVDEWNTYGIHSWDLWRQQLNYFVRTDAFKAPYRKLDLASPVLTNGTVRVGDQLKVTAPSVKSSTGSAVSGATLKYAWLRNGVPILGATSNSYLVTATDLGSVIGVRVTANKAGFDESTQDTILSSRVQKGLVAMSARPAITGKVKVKSTLRAVAPKISVTGAKYTYRWQRNGRLIKGANKATYKLTKKDRGTKIRVRVEVSKPGYQTLTVLSWLTAKVKR